MKMNGRERGKGWIPTRKNSLEETIIQKTWAELRWGPPLEQVAVGALGPCLGGKWAKRVWVRQCPGRQPPAPPSRKMRKPS